MRACSILPRDMPRSYEPHCTQSWESRITSVRYCNALNSTLFEKCRAKVDPKYYFNACRLDMCECPGDQCHCEVLTAYARECERAGLMIHDWREPTGCRNVTSFRYSGTNQISREDSDDDNDVESSDKNEVLLSADAIEEISKTKFVSAHVGDFLPGCSPDNAEHCAPDIDLQEQERRPRKKESKKGQKDKQTRKERREKRRRERKEKQRQKKRQERLKKKRERKRLRRIREKERRERLKQNRKKNRQLIEEEEEGEEEATEEYGGVLVTKVSGDTKRKLSWAKFEKGKPPPFEFLLNSSPALGSGATVPKDPDEEEEEDTEDYQVDGSINYGATTRSQVKPGLRVPLPLFEGINRGAVKDSDSLETAGVSSERTSSDPGGVDDLPSQRDRQNWKTTRRRNGE